MDSGETPGYQLVPVWLAPRASWLQKTVWVSPRATSDDLKWHLRHTMGCNVSTYRVHSGWRGTPYDRKTPVTRSPPGAATDDHPTVLLFVPSFGP